MTTPIPCAFHREEPRPTPTCHPKYQAVDRVVRILLPLVLKEVCIMRGFATIRTRLINLVPIKDDASALDAAILVSDSIERMKDMAIYSDYDDAAEGLAEKLLITMRVFHLAYLCLNNARKDTGTVASVRGYVERAIKKSRVVTGGKPGLEKAIMDLLS